VNAAVGFMGVADPFDDAIGHASIDLEFTVGGYGPIRPGFANFLLYASPIGGADWAYASVDGIGGCGPICSEQRTMVPILLGVPYTVRLGAHASRAQFYLGSAAAIIFLQFLEANGEPFNPIPEPGSFWLLAALAGGCFAVCRVRGIRKT
jgi:hypothetical protein